MLLVRLRGETRVYPIVLEDCSRAVNSEDVLGVGLRLLLSTDLPPNNCTTSRVGVADGVADQSNPPPSSLSLTFYMD